MSRRLAPALLLALISSMAAAATAPDLATPEGRLLAMRRIQCSEVDGKAVTYYWKGSVFSRVPGEPDRQLFKVCLLYTSRCV